MERIKKSRKGRIGMCNNTKQKIAQTLRQMMAQCRFQKITVGNLMDATGMKRQSFYYHFQDTREVLLWICQQEFLEPLQASDLPLTEWILYALKLIDQDRAFYRKMLEAITGEFVREFDTKVMRPKMAALLYGADTPLTKGQQFVVDFGAQAATTRIILFAESRRPLNEQEVREKTSFLLSQLRTGINIDAK
jgi:AcrR family transcriptional regulator